MDLKKISFNENCTACLLCTKVCPAGVFLPIYTPTTPIIRSVESCIGCGHCEAVCPHDAIECSEFRKKGHTVELTEDLTTQFSSLRSVRNYKKQAISETDIEALVQCGYDAPTAQNVREIHINSYTGDDVLQIQQIVVDRLKHLIKIAPPILTKAIDLFYKRQDGTLTQSVDKLKRVTGAIAAGQYHVFHQAPNIIVIHAPKKNRFAKDDSNIAMSHMRMLAHAKGLGSCIIGFAYTANKDLCEHLNIPKQNSIYGVLAIGEPTIKYARGIARNKH